MDKTDKVLKQFSKPEPKMVTPIGTDIIIPNFSGTTGSKAVFKFHSPLQVLSADGSKDLTLTVPDGTAANTFDADNSWNFTKGGTNVLNIVSTSGQGSVCINKGASQNPVASATLELVSTSRGFLPTRMTTAQKNAISSPATGLIVYDTDLNKLCIYTTAWETITSA